MSIANFIPELWSARLLSALKKSLVYANPNIINSDYEGDIANVGDTVRINSIGDVTISDYTRNTDINPPEALSDAQQTLIIDQGKYFNFAVDDVDAAQAKPSVMGEAIDRAGYGMRDKADQFVAALYPNIANLYGSDGSPKVPSSNTDGTTVYDYLIDMGVLLDQSNIPRNGRFAILPPWMCGTLLKDNRFISFGTDANRAALQSGQLVGAEPDNGVIGMAAGFMISMSNNVPVVSSTKYKVIAGHKMGWTYADQIMKTEAYRPQLRFSDAVKGLHVYGAKIVRPDALVLGTFSQS